MALTKIVTNAITDDAVTAGKIADGTIVAADLAANSVDSSELVNGSIDLAHMSVNSIDSDQYVDGSIDTAHYAAGSVDTTALGADSVTAAKIADDVVNSEHYAAGSIDNEHIADDAIDSEHYADGSIDLVHMSSQSVDEDNLYISNAGSDGQYLQKQSGNNGGLTWAAVTDAAITAINNPTANELVTVGSTTTELDAESLLTFTGTVLTLGVGTSVINSGTWSPGTVSTGKALVLGI